MPELYSSQHAEEVDFAAFLAAIRDYEAEAGEPRTTAHSSSVTTEDWQRIQDSIRSAAGR